MMKLEEMVTQYLLSKQGVLQLQHKKILSKYLDYLLTLTEGTIAYGSAIYVTRYDEDAVKQDLIDFLRQCRSDDSKTRNLKCINSFWSFARDTWNLSWTDPEIQIPTSEFERQIAIVKYMQGKKVSIEGLCNHFGYAERTIRKDLKAIRDGDGLWKNCPVDGIRTINHDVTYECSIQPFFLAFNLTNVALLLRALNYLEQSGYHETSFIAPLKEQLWAQLEEYGRQQMQKGEVTPFIEKTASRFAPESDFVDNVRFMLVMAVKEGKPVNILYLDEDKQERQERITIRSDGRQRFVFYKVGSNTALPIKEDQVIKIIPIPQHSR